MLAMEILCLLEMSDSVHFVVFLGIEAFWPANRTCRNYLGLHLDPLESYITKSFCRLILLPR